MKPPLILALLILPLTVRAALPTEDLALNITLLPNTRYVVTADVSTNAVTALLALLGGGTSPLQILDGNGNVLGEVPVENLIDLLTGLTGTVTRQVNTVVETAGTAVNGITARVLAGPTFTVTNVKVLASSNQSPIVKITSRKKSGGFLLLRGTASDDQKVSKVEVVANGRLHRARGTVRWTSRTAIHSGVNRIMVRAFDNTGMSSASGRIKVKN